MDFLRGSAVRVGVRQTPWIRSARTIKRPHRLTVHQYVESPIVRDDRVDTQAALDLVDQPVGRGDGVVSVSAEDLLPGSPQLLLGDQTREWVLHAILGHQDQNETKNSPNKYRIET